MSRSYDLLFYCSPPLSFLFEFVGNTCLWFYISHIHKCSLGMFVECASLLSRSYDHLFYCLFFFFPSLFLFVALFVCFFLCLSTKTQYKEKEMTKGYVLNFMLIYILLTYILDGMTCTVLRYSHFYMVLKFNLSIGIGCWGCWRGTVCNISKL